MELKTAIEILEYHQEWRLGKREDMIHEPKKLTEALDIVIEAVKNVKPLNEEQTPELGISDVITRFGLPDETEEKVLRFLHLKGMIKTKTYVFSNFDDVYREMCELREWLGRL
jgi:hypothetical protein